MKKIVLIVTTAIILALTSVLLVACDLFSNQSQGAEYGNEHVNYLSSQVVRIHIRANSNSDEDQRVKLLVRDKITEYLSEILCDCTSKTDALTTIQIHGTKLKQIADLTLNASGFDYKSVVSVKNELFPDKAYGDLFFPKGNYDALIIELGSGAGDNWWCVAFPPLCFVPDGDGEDVAYKSWVKEIIDKIFD